jgi:predicted short-subunit dehydrogenase-like oxidoreductase (DUF2520 family)
VDAETAHAALAALLEGAAHNARRAGPVAALTGPVARGDQDAIAAHLDALAAHPDARELYLTLTRAMESLLTTQPVADDGAAQVA